MNETSYVKHNHSDLHMKGDGYWISPKYMNPCLTSASMRVQKLQNTKKSVYSYTISISLTQVEKYFTQLKDVYFNG